MADFRKWFYAFAGVALLTSLAVSADAQAMQCNTQSANPFIVRGQAYADLVGDFVLNCSGGVSTAPGLPVPGADIRVFLTTNITSKILATAGSFSEALLIIDDPNSPSHPATPILNCGATTAPDNIGFGPGICGITAGASPAGTYNGTAGHPNVFQGRVANNGSLFNAIDFLGVPLDPPGTALTRTFRIVNVRADAEFYGVSGTFTTQTLTMTIGITSNTALTIANPSQVVAVIQNGLTVSVANARLDFVQCNAENGKLDTGTASQFIPLGNCTAATCGGVTGGGNNNLITATTGGAPLVQFKEGFPGAWKPKNISYITPPTGFGTQVGSGYAFAGALPAGFTAVPADQNQNVPGAIYNSESGFSYQPSPITSPVPNPPPGVNTGCPSPTTIGCTGGNTAGSPPAFGSGTTGIAGAGVATQGTRLAVSFASIPSGSKIFVPPVIYLYRQGVTPTPAPFPFTSAAATGGVNTGVMVLTATAADGSGAFTAALNTAGTGPNLNLQQVSVTGGNGLAVYEVLFADAFNSEEADVPVVVSFTPNLNTNLPIGLPVTGQTAQATGSFAPFYSTGAARNPSSTLPVPRFTNLPATPGSIFSIQKCACNLLFPFVTTQSAGGQSYDTGIAIANASLDPGANAGFLATPQQGTVTFYYFGSTPSGAALNPQTSAVVPAGQVITYDVFSGGGTIGITPNGLTSAAGVPNFLGYIIAQSQFQYCHGYAFISNLGNPAGGISEGYLGIVLDKPNTLPRTVQASGENDGH